jgi:molybdate transport system regulatory protein
MTNRPSRPTPHATQPPATLQSAHENIIAARVKTKVWLELGGEFFVGDGGIHLLGGILQHGSLAQTVREIGWSYRHAWGYLRRAERALQTPIVRNRAGRGPTGPTPAEVAARGRDGRRASRARPAPAGRKAKPRRA